MLFLENKMNISSTIVLKRNKSGVTRWVIYKGNKCLDIVLIVQTRSRPLTNKNYYIYLMTLQTTLAVSIWRQSNMFVFPVNISPP